MFKKDSLAFHLFDIGLNIVIIIAIVGVIRTFLVSPFQVEGRSMYATLEDDEYIIINKLVYFLQNPERGEIVVFHPPNDPNKYYVKRIIGQAGDTVILREGDVYLVKSGTTTEIPLNETYLNEDNIGQTYPHPPNKPYTAETAEVQYTVPEGHYFLMGDNRTGSSDSRSFRAADGEPIPFVEENAIKGRVWVVALPISRIHALEQVEY